MSQYLPAEISGGMPVEFYIFTLGGSVIAEWTSGSTRRLSGGFGSFFGTCEPAPIRHEAIEATDERSAGGLRVLIPADDASTNAVADLFRGTTPIGVVGLSLYRIHLGSPVATGARIFFGDVASAEFAGSTCTLTVEPKAGAFKQRVLRQLYQGPCNNTLYDSFCAVIKANFSAAATVTAIASDNITLTVPVASGQADGYYTGGQLQFGSRHGFIVDHVGTTLVLLRAVPGLIVSASVTISAGCDRTIVTCNDKFGNVANHMGFPLIPNLDPFTNGVGKLTP